MATQTRSVGTVLNGDFYGYGIHAWADPDNIKVSDDSKAVATRVDEFGQYTYTLYCTNFGFTIPAGSVITKITVKIEAMSDHFDNNIDWCNLLRYGNQSFSRARGAVPGDFDPAQPLTGVDVVYSVNPVNAGDGDLWGTPWAAADVNDTSFGCVFDCYIDRNSTISIDHVSIVVDYEEGETLDECQTRSCDRGFESVDAAIKATFGRIIAGVFEDCVGLKAAPALKDCQGLTELKACGMNLTLEQAFKAALINDGCGNTALRLFVVFPAG